MLLYEFQAKLIRHYVCVKKMLCVNAKLHENTILGWVNFGSIGVFLYVSYIPVIVVLTCQ